MTVPIVLAGNDNRWGHYAPDGSYASYPTIDIFGAPIERGLGTVRRVNAALFVVIPPGRDSDELVVLPASAMIEPPVDDAPAERKGRK